MVADKFCGKPEKQRFHLIRERLPAAMPTPDTPSSNMGDYVMILALSYTELTKYPSLLDQMFRLRAQVFHDRLGWDVKVVDGWEKDSFDDQDPLYVLSVSGDRQTLYGSCRLLPTSGPHMMSDVFGAHFDPDTVIRTPLIWEITRFCTSDAKMNTSTPSGLNLPTIEMLAGVCELGLTYGMSHVTAVFEPIMGRVYRRAGLRTSILGKTRTLGPKPVYAGLWELTQATLAALQKSGGFSESVLAVRTEERAEHAA